MRRIKILMSIAAILLVILLYRLFTQAFEHKQAYEQQKIDFFREEAKHIGMSTSR